MNTSHTTYVPYWKCAATLGVPSAWLRREALAGRVPALKAGRRLLLDPVAVRVALDRRSTGDGEYGDED